jgi:hypothetical protein
LRWRVRDDEAPRDLEPRESWHLHVQKHDIGLELSGQAKGFHAVRRLSNDLDLGLAEQKAQLFACELLVIDYENAHTRQDYADARSAASNSGISMRAAVPWPG